MTQNGKLILDIVMNSNAHLTAEQIFLQLKQTAPKIVLSTVYNNLNTLCEQGMLRKVSIEGSPDRYDKNTKHDHLVCKQCGALSDKTFADLYMKSGLYITGLVKRLFRSKKMKQLFPNDHERIKHIMEHQVYGFAPTRIIYLIATNYIFGFDKDLKDSLMEKNFKQVDAAKYAQEGTLQDVVQREFEK